MELVSGELEKLGEGRHDQRPALQKEIEELDRKVKGWSESLAKPDLSPGVRTALEEDWASALDRRQEIESILLELEFQKKQAECLVSPKVILERLVRLADVLATNNPTMGNLELSLHIDKIDCSPDGKVVMRSCKLGSLAEAAGLLSNVDELSHEGIGSERDKEKKRASPRRRGRLRVFDSDDNDVDLRALAEFAADPNRFNGLSDEWFWTDEFQIPGRPPSWATKYAEAVFRRRQEAKLSYKKLAAEFGVTAPTARAAVKHYLAEHPEARDEVDLPRGGPRRPRIDVAQFADEAARLWEAGWSKLKLAEKFGCSSPIIDKALAHACKRDGRPVTTWQDRREAVQARARQMLAEGQSLQDIAKTLEVSDVTARQYLKAAFAAEGKPMPDQRIGRRKPRD